jgi:hypothetical protein
MEVVGFNVYRRVGESGEREQLNGELIFAQHSGASEGAWYELRDVGIEPGQTYSYTLEMVMVEGEATSHEMGVVSTGWWMGLPLVLG